MTFEELHKIEELVREFLPTLDYTNKNEWWTTDCEVGSHFLGEFIDWLGQKIGNEV